MTDATDKLLGIIPVIISAKIVKGFLPDDDKKKKKSKGIFGGL